MINRIFSLHKDFRQSFSDDINYLFLMFREDGLHAVFVNVSLQIIRYTMLFFTLKRSARFAAENPSLWGLRILGLPFTVK